MRFLEFNLAEATLQRTSTSSWADYLQNLINAKDIGVGKQGERHSGQKLDDKSKSIVKSLIAGFANAKNKLDFAKHIEDTEVTLLPDKIVVPIKHIHKSAEIKGSGADSGKEKKPWNEGEVAETILGAALLARFTSKKDITEKQVWDALKLLANNVVPGGFRVANKRNKKSPIDMTALNKPMNNLVIDKLVHNKAELKQLYPEGVKALEEKIEACASYVNESSKVIAALEQADASPGAPITIKTDGVGDQKGTKADLQISVGDYKQLLSLKVNDIKQFGQDSGSSGTIITTFFKRFIPNFDISDLYMNNGEPIPWTPETGEGWPEMDNKKVTNQLKANNLWDAALKQVYKLTGMAYQKAAAQLQDQLSTPSGAADVVTNIYNGIIHHVQGSAQFQTLVILNPSAKQAWKELEFGPSLQQALSNYTLEVDVEIGERGGGNHKLRIYGTPATPEAQLAAQIKINSKADAKKAKKKIDSGEVLASSPRELLFQLRSYQQESGSMRNPVEMGPLLKDLTEVQKIDDVPDSTPDQPLVQQPDQIEQPAQQTIQEPQQGQSNFTSKMQPIEPATDVLPQDDQEPDEQSDDLDRMRKNAGITV
jgi:hypothetical protein